MSARGRNYFPPTKIPFGEKGTSMTTKYGDCYPLRTKPCLAWEVAFEDGSFQLELTCPEMTVEEVIAMVKVHNSGRKFNIKAITVGEYKIQERTNTYCVDGRRINQNLDMIA